jgi:FAD/FMN-containing dehydrogenase
MDRRKFLKASAVASIASRLPRPLFAAPAFSRVRPGDPAWPSKDAWKRLSDEVGGNLISVDFPASSCISSFDSPACKTLVANIRNPFYVGDTPGLTQTLGWVDAWTSKPSVYAVAARNAHDIAAAVNFAREHNLRLVVKGGGHSYQGTSNAPDSLLIWTRHMHDIQIQDDFVPQGCSTPPQRAVTVGSGTIWLQAYDAVTTKAGAYVQGGGCTTVGVAGLVQSGGFGSFSKKFGSAASSLLEAEVVTADGKIRIANACNNADLFWALKGGGGGTFGAVSKLTLRLHDLPEFAGGAIFTVKAASDDAYRRLIRHFVGFYSESLFNDHWGEQVHVNGDNELEISLVNIGLETAEIRKIWQPFLDWLAQSPSDYKIQSDPVLGSMPTRHWWDPGWRAEHHQSVFKTDSRPGSPSTNVWWNGDGGQVAWVIWGFESLWLPASLLHTDAQDKLADALFSASRHSQVELHFNKGLAGAPAEAIARAKDTAMNPAVCDAFALAIVADGQGPAYPGIAGHEPDAVKGRKAAENVHRCMNELRTVAATTGAYVSESNYFESDFQHAYWGANHQRLAAIKKKYDPDGLFFVHNGVGSEQWSPDGFTRL